jgi:hypothetical protein
MKLNIRYDLASVSEKKCFGVGVIEGNKSISESFSICLILLVQHKI